MLKGFIKYRDADIGEARFDVLAEDSFYDLKLYMGDDDMSNLDNYSKAIDLLDKGEYYEVVGNEKVRRVYNKEIDTVVIDGKEVKPEEVRNPNGTRVLASLFRRLDIQRASKFKTNITNYEMATRISSVIRYVQQYSNSSTSNYDFTLDQQKGQQPGIDIEEYFETKRVVQIDDKGFVETDSSLIKKLSIRTKYVDIYLEEIQSQLDIRTVFGPLERKDKYDNIKSATKIKTIGFSLTEENLGFKYEPKVANGIANVLGLYTTMEDVISANPEKNYTWLKGRKYEIVNDDEKVVELVKEFMEFDGPIAYDTETTGLKITFKSREGEGDQLVGIVLSKEIGTGYYIPVQHKLFRNVFDGDHQYFMEKYMKDLLEQKDIIVHNLSFDWKVTYIYGILINVVMDTMLAFAVTKKYEDKTYETSLKNLTKNLFGVDSVELEDLVEGKFGESQINFSDLPYSLVQSYAPADGDWTLTLYEYIKRTGLIEKYNAQQVLDIELNFAKVVAYSEFYGYHIETTEIPRLKEKIVGNMDKYKSQMLESVPKELARDFNPSSPLQLQTVIYDHLGIEQKGAKKTTDKEFLNSIVDITDESGELKYPFIKSLLNYRQNESIFKNFLKKVNNFASSDGFIFPQVFATGTNTGRASVKEPNYQSYNDPVKEEVTPRKGYIHFDCDFSQIEYRVLASMAKQENLITEFEDPDLDYHTYQASRMFSIPYSQVSKELRSQSKGINFGLPYGMGDSSLGVRIFGVRSDATRKKAEKLRIKFFEGQENIEELFKKVRDEGVRNNFTETYYGRRRYYNKSKFNESSIRRQAGNHVIQGTAADIYKIAVNRMFNRVVDEGLLDLVIFNAFIHDELLMEVHESINPYWFFKIWREEFQPNIKGFCQLYAGAGVGKSWYEAKKQDLPPQYIQELIEIYDSGESESKDFSVFIDDTNKGYKEYKDRRIKEHFTDVQNIGKVVKPIIYSLLNEVVNDYVKGVVLSSDYEEITKIRGLVFDPETVPYVVKDNKKYKSNLKSMGDLINIHSYVHGYSEDVIGVLSPEDVEKQENETNELELEEVHFKDDVVDFKPEDMVKMQGYHLDRHEKVLYLQDRIYNDNGVQTTILDVLVKANYIRNKGEYQIAVMNSQTNKFDMYQAYATASTSQMIISKYTNANRYQSNYIGVQW